MMSDDVKLLPHPLADLFPPIQGGQYLNFKGDIERNGLRTEIVIYEGKILDGRSRFRACLEIGIPIRRRQHDGSDPLAFVLSSNAYRRHLRPSQLALIAAEAIRLRATTTPQICGRLTHSRVAETLGISRRQVDKASAFLKAVDNGRAIPELRTAVRDGRRSLHRMEKLSHASPDEQRKALAPAVRCTFGKSGLHRRDWDREFDEIASRIIGPCRLGLGLAMEADGAGQLTPNRWKRLVDSCRQALGVMDLTTKEVQRLNRFPFEDE